MGENQKLILRLCQQAHALAEVSYLEHPAARGETDWLEKRKYLIADISLHMVQGALQGEQADSLLLRRYLYSLLILCEEFLPGEGLSAAAEKLLEKQAEQQSSVNAEQI